MSQRANSSLRLKFQFLPLGYNSAYSLSLPLSTCEISAVLNCSIDLLPPHAFDRGSVLNIKGRDGLAESSSELPHSLRPRGEELLLIQGKVFLAEDSAGKLIPETFSVRLSTKFQSFEGKHIRHLVHEERTGSLPDWLRCKDLPNAFPLEIEYFRLGIEYFTPKLITGLIGFTPTVTDSLSIELYRQELKLSIQFDSKRRRQFIPFDDKPTLGSLADGLKHILDLDLRADYIAQLTNK